MPAVGQALAGLIIQKCDRYIAGVRDVPNYSGPLSQKNPSYFIEFCTAIGKGIADGTPVVQFKTVDTGLAGAPPIPGVGIGIGIMVDQAWFEENLYENICQAVLQTFGKRPHPPYAQAKGTAGEYLKAICQGVTESVQEHYKICWNLSSAHPIVYIGAGKIVEGAYSGIQANLVHAQIMANGPRLKGRFWPILAKAVADTYVEAIHKHSTGKVTITGICVPSPGQVCGLPIPGVGTGVAA